jgi:hypothetical protein
MLKKNCQENYQKYLVIQVCSADVKRIFYSVILTNKRPWDKGSNRPKMTYPYN